MRSLILLFSFVLALPAFAATPAPTLKSVLDQHARAVGPVEKVQSRRMRLRVIGMAPFEIPVVSEGMRPNLIRKEVTVQGNVQVTAFDGKEAWKVDPFVPGGDKPALLPPQEAKALLGEADFDGILLGHAAKGIKLAYKGTAMVDGKPAHVLGATLADGSPATIWLDGASFLEVKRTQQGLVMGEMKPVDIASSDYRLVDGVRIPHRMEVGLSGAKEKMAIVMDAVELNVKIDPARFARPVK